VKKILYINIDKRVEIRIGVPFKKKTMRELLPSNTFSLGP